MATLENSTVGTDNNFEPQAARWEDFVHVGKTPDIASAYLGGGSYAVVYRERHRSTGEEVALKVPNKAFPDATFDDEIRLLNALSHPNIVPILYHSTPGERAFIAFPVLGSVQGVGRTALPGILADVARAIDYIHSRATVHCDVKEENVLVEDGCKGYLGDFGIARRAQKAVDYDKDILDFANMVTRLTLRLSLEHALEMNAELNTVLYPRRPNDLACAEQFLDGFFKLSGRL